jgi:hypothetical protein
MLSEQSSSVPVESMESIPDKQQKQDQQVHEKQQKETNRMTPSKAHLTLEKLVQQNQLLEELCRKLQQENGQLRDAEKSMKSKFQDSLNSITAKYEQLLQDMSSKHSTTQENLEFFKDKFKAYLEEFDAREEHFKSLMKAKGLEVSLAEAKLKEQITLREQDQLQIQSLNQQLSLHTSTETELRKQLGLYVEKFKQVEETLNKSNDLFITFRKEMEQVFPSWRCLFLELSSLINTIRNM